VTWQVVPTVLGQLLQDKDAEKSKKVMQAMMQMDKLDIADLKRAHEQQYNRAARET
jgi:predicted 3-demethylubiquinone-9 3-methyltransferase (glyoxalase superfamily)